MNQLLNSSLAQDLGMMLVHSLWQIVLIAVVFAVANRGLVRWSANLRYVVAYVALLLMLVLPLLTLFGLCIESGSSSVPTADLASQIEPLYAVESASESIVDFPMDEFAFFPVEAGSAADATANLNRVATEPATEQNLSWILPWLTVGWAFGVIAFSLRPLVALHRCHRLRKQAQPIESGWIAETFVALCSRIGLKAKVEIACSTLAHVPTVMGFVRPIVLLPLSMVTGQSAHELSAIIAHELAHVRRHDFLLNLFQTVIETLLFYHPAAWWVSSVVRQERENCCDDIAMLICGRKNYAKALANLEFARSNEPGLAMAVDGGSLYRRIHRIVRPQEHPSPLGRGLAALIALTALLLGAVAVLPTETVTVAADELQAADKSEASIDEDAASVTNDEEKESRPDEAFRTYDGKVLDADGQPVSGVKVYAENTSWDRKTKKQVSHEIQATLSSDDGSYSLTFKPQNGMNQVIATKKGYGPAIMNYDGLHKLFEAGETHLDLQLSREKSIQGRVVDTEGNPLKGVTIHVDQIALPQSEDAVVQWIANEKPELFSLRDRQSFMMNNDARITKTAFPVSAVVRHGSAIPKDVSTDADGSFQLNGLAENCRVRLTLSGPNIARRHALVVTRQMKKIMAYAAQVRNRDFTHHGASPILVASPTQPIVGRLVDAETRQPLANIPVHLVRAGKNEWVRGMNGITAITDLDGRFRLIGAPLGGQHIVEVEPPLDQPYFQTKRELPKASGSAPLQCDFELPRTKWIRGRVTDETGEAVVATLEFYPFRDNPHAEPFEKFDPQIAGSVPDDKFDTDENGSFRIKAISGPAILAAVAKDRKERPKYRPNRAHDLIDRIGGQDMRKVYNGWSADYFDALVEVNLSPDSEELTQDLVFKFGKTRSLRITDDKGRSVSEVYAIGRTFPPNHRLEALKSSRLDVIGLKPDEARMVVLIDEQRELGKILNVRGDESDEIDVRLLPCAIVSGRVVDEDGAGVSNISIRVSPVQEPKSDSWSRELKESMTDDLGRFRIPLPSGGAYRIFAYSDVGPNFSAKIRPKSATKYDLGDLKHEDKLEETDTEQLTSTVTSKVSKTSSSAISSASASTKPSRIRGQVLDSKGKGVASTVHVVMKQSGMGIPGREQVLRSVESTSDGRFDFSMVLPKRDASIDRGVWHAKVLQLVATANGYGPGVGDLIGIRKGKPIELRVSNDEIPITGTIRTLEGEPVAGASIRVAMLDCTADVDQIIHSLQQQAKREKPGRMAASFFAVSDFLSPGIDLDANERIVATKLQHSRFVSKRVKTDAEGKFLITGIGRDRILALELSGPGIVKTWINVITRDMPSINAAFFHGGRTRITYGAKFTYSAEPSQPIVGTIKDAETGKPIEGVQVVSSGPRSSAVYVGAVTDSNGKYRLEGLPKSKRYSLNITPPQDKPYLPRRYVDVSEVANGLEPTSANFDLRRALWYSGRVLNKATGKPVQARVVYSPHIDNQFADEYPALVKGRFFAGSMFDERGISVATDRDGRFRVRVIPGTGLILVRCNDANFCSGFGRESLGKKWWGYEGQRMTNTYQPIFPNTVHRLWPIEMGEATDETVQDITVNPGQTYQIRLTGPGGKPISDVTVVGRNSPGMFGRERPTTSDRITISAISPETARTVFFYHEERNLGALLPVPIQANKASNRWQLSDDGQRLVQLHPCATVKGRLLDRNGKPMSGISISIKPVHSSDADQHFIIARTDAQGQFNTRRIIPNGELTFRELSSGKGTIIAKNATLRPGEVRDFGEIRVEIDAPKRRFANGAQASD